METTLKIKVLEEEEVETIPIEEEVVVDSTITMEVLHIIISLHTSSLTHSLEISPIGLILLIMCAKFVENQVILYWIAITTWILLTK